MLHASKRKLFGVRTLFLVHLATSSPIPPLQHDVSAGDTSTPELHDHSEHDVNIRLSSPHSLSPRMDPHQQGQQHAAVYQQTPYGPNYPAKDLKDAVDYCRSVLQPAIEGDVNNADQILTNAFRKPDPINNTWQRPPAGRTGSEHLAQWDIKDYSEDNTFYPTWHSIIPALKDLKVGSDDGNNQKDLSIESWQVPRFIDTGLLHPPRSELGNTGWNLALEVGGLGGGADFKTIYNIVDGVIIVQKALSPYHQMKDQERGWEKALPKIAHLSDMLWAMWFRLHGSTFTRYGLDPGGIRDGLRSNLYLDALRYPDTTSNRPRRKTLDNDDLVKMRTFLNWVVVQDINVFDVKRVVASCLLSRGWHSGGETGYPSPQTQEIFSVGHWCFYALLAQPINRGVAFFLIQHKGPNGLSRKLLKSVTILYVDQTGSGSTGTNRLRNPTLIWEVVDDGDHHADVVGWRQRTESGWLTLNGWELVATEIPLPHTYVPMLTDTGLTPAPGHSGLTPGPADEGSIPIPGHSGSIPGPGDGWQTPRPGHYPWEQ